MLKRVLATAGLILIAASSPTPAQATPPAAAAAGGVGIAADIGPCPHGGEHPNLRRGDHREAVAHLQCLLPNVWKYSDVKVDGDYGPMSICLRSG